MKYNNIGEALKATDLLMEQHGEKVHTERWQSLDIADRPEAEMVEVMHPSLQAPLLSENLDYYQDEIEPNLPWADDHFLERICGAPINPGIQWANWPWGKHANQHRKGDMFNHNYMERYWPKYAATVSMATETPQEFGHLAYNPTDEAELIPHRGLRHDYGDLNDVIQLLAQEPQTRQAYMPIWFPEDTGVTHSGRKPCTLGYHFIMRKGKLDIRYDIRSCDLFRHFRDDVYLTIRLVKHVLDECRKINPKVWDNITLGTYVMHITSLHMFVSDYYVKFGKQPQ